MRALFSRLLGPLNQTYTQLWVRALRSKGSSKASMLALLMKFEEVVKAVLQNVVDTLSRLCAALPTIPTTGNKMAKTLHAQMINTYTTRDITTLPSEHTIKHTAVGDQDSATPGTSQDSIASDDWQLLINGEGAIASLQDWSSYNWPKYPDQFSDEVVKGVFLPAARVMSLASDLSYSDASDAQDFLGSGFWKVVVIDSDNAQAMLFMTKDKHQPPVMILAFRGTEGPGLTPWKYHKFWPDLVRDCQFLPDWFRNVDMTTEKYYGDSKGAEELEVHAGFLSGWRALKGPLMEQIHNCYNEHGAVVQLYVTGHSQGGALAGISLLDLLHDEEHQPSPVYKVKGCLALAAPKHGGQAFAVAVADAVAKHQIPFDLLANQNGTGCDPVVCVPPCMSAHAPFYVAPAGRLWVVEAGRKTTGPATDQQKDHVVNASLMEAVQRAVTSTALHSIGTSVGYLSALRD